jgi:hypothetical protein
MLQHVSIMLDMFSTYIGCIGFPIANSDTLYHDLLQPNGEHTIIAFCYMRPFEVIHSSFATLTKMEKMLQSVLHTQRNLVTWNCFSYNDLNPRLIHLKGLN